MELTLDLIAAAKTDATAANALFAIAKQRIVAPFARKRCETEWEDVTQSTLMKAWIGFRTFRGNVSQFAKWLRTICYREIVSTWRRAKSFAELQYEPLVESEYCELYSILSRREFDILREMADGATMHDIAVDRQCSSSRIQREATRQRVQLLELISI